MRRQLIIAFVLISIGVAIWIAASNRSIGPKRETTSLVQYASPQVQPSPVTSVSQSTQIDTTSHSHDQTEAEVRRRDAEDKTWEWKIPIRFYGKVVDENGAAVAGADVRFQWTNLSTRGTTEVSAKSDDQGLFSLANVEGKRLLVRVTKNGYYSSDSRNRLSFEYANPFEEIYHRPIQDNPVVFHLRKQRPSASLLTKATEVFLPGDGSSTNLKLETGRIAPDGELIVKAWKPWPPRPMSPPYDWKVLLTLRGGGFGETTEEFPFHAPDDGYTPEYTVDMVAALASQWKISAERTLYFTFGEPKRYGRLTLRTDGNSRYIFLDYVINPSGSRDLETAK
jgi:hypothetical protein